MNLNQKKIRCVMNLGTHLFALSMVGLAIYGGVINYSPIPFWDMWEGDLGFLMRLNSGAYISWWSQHNEHRIALARILFWIDSYAFDGKNIFLIFLNYAAASASCLIFLLFIRRLSEKNKENIKDITGTHHTPLWMLIIALSYLWTQKENFTWAFQSQFFLAQFLPLAALYFLSEAKVRNSWPFFIAASAAGVISIGAMANGVLALPAMFVASFFMRHDAIKMALLLVLSVAEICAYFYGYETPVIHGNLLTELKKSPFGLLHYTLLYLGSPFYYLSGEKELGKFIAVLSGASLVFFSCLIGCREFLQNKRSAHTVSLIFFIIFIGGTAFGTAGGRLIFGLDQALSMRYTTPATMAWSALFVACFGSGRVRGKLGQKVLIVLFFFIAVAMLKYQIKATEPMDEILSARETAVLAATLDIRDETYIRNISDSTNSVLQISKEAKEKRYSVFGQYPFLNLDKEISTHYDVGAASTCLASLDNWGEIEGSSDYLRVGGWMFSMQRKSSPKLLRFVNQQGNIVGFALTGTPRTDVAKLIHSKGKLSGFRGYILAAAQEPSIMIVGDDPHCSAKVNFP